MEEVMCVDSHAPGRDAVDGLCMGGHRYAAPCGARSVSVLESGNVGHVSRARTHAVNLSPRHIHCNRCIVLTHALTRRLFLLSVNSLRTCALM
jgi:hypothetical protein